MKSYVSKWLGFDDEAPKHEEIVRIPVVRIVPNRHQPRQHFDPQAIEELARTISLHGMIQPIVVRPLEDGRYELIAGERRWRAAKLLGHVDVPAVVRALDDVQAASLALIENLQRENLSPIEEAEAYVRLMELHALTQEALAQRLGKGQSTIANKIRLLSLPDEVKEGLIRRRISERHARALLPLKDAARIEALFRQLVDEGWTVQETEARVAKALAEATPEGTSRKRRTPLRKAVSRDVRLAINTIRRSIDMVKSVGLPLEVEEADEDEQYRVTIRIPKRRT
ncbi:MAG: nucleoid occlusion protein [Hydrogenibacillus sp.]|nr:nucleoid occlusion protein [Hydrogenibacillus sp.]